MLTSRTVFRRKNGRNRRIPPYPSHTELHGGYCHNNTLKTEIKKNNNEQTCYFTTVLLRETHPVAPAVGTADRRRRDTPERRRARHSSAGRRMLPDSGATYPGRSASADCERETKNAPLVLTPEDNPSGLMKCGLPDLPTDTGFRDKGRTLRTRPRMT